MVTSKQKEEPKLNHTFIDGYERVIHEYDGEVHDVRIHRLSQVAEHGFEEVNEKVVHHKNRVRCDNSPLNLELMTPEEHGNETLSDLPWDRVENEYSREELQEMYYERGLTISDIACVVGVTCSTMSSVFQRLGLNKDRTSRIPEENPWSDKELMKELYVEQSMNIKEISNHLGCHRSTISEWLQKHGIESGDHSSYDYADYDHKNSLNNKDRPWEDTEALRRKYVEQGKSMSTIANEWNTTAATVKRSLKIKDIDIRSLKGKGDRPKPWRDEDTLRDLYYQKDMTQEDIANELGCSNYTISTWMNKHDIKTR